MKHSTTMKTGRSLRNSVWGVLAMLMLLANTAFAQDRVVKGTITSAGDNAALPGVNILIKGTSIGTITDFDGNFQLNVPSNESVLVVSFIGYLTQEIAVGNQSAINVVLEADIAQLDEIVVVGYGVQKKSVTTGAIASIKSEDIIETPITNAGQALQGRTPGVNITTVSGAPGSGVDIRVRGTGSNGNNTPLFVVDGMQMSNIDFLNPGDIESIEVLKDASSAAIYGSRGANGVVLVTTKKGKEGRLTVNYDGYYGVQSAWRQMPVLNSYEYMMLHNEGYINDGLAPKYTPEQIADNTVDTDWQNEVFQTAPITSHTVQLSGGNATSTFMASVGYLGQDGIIGGGDKSHFDRLTLRLNSSHKISKYVTFGQNLNYVVEKSNGVDQQNVFGGMLQNATLHDPLTPVYVTDSATIAAYDNKNVQPVKSADGRYYGISDKGLREIVNPMARLENTYNTHSHNKLVANAYVEIRPVIEGLKFRSDVGTEIGNGFGRGYTPSAFYNVVNMTENSSAYQNMDEYQHLQWENVLSYDKTVGDHNLSAMVGMTARQSAGTGLNGSRTNMQIEGWDYAWLVNGANNDSQKSAGWAWQHRLMSYFGRASYNFQEKYMLTGTLRYDGSSNFGSNNQFGIFPSIQGGWVLSEEDFIKDIDAINFMKLRAAYGTVGNEAIGAFGYMEQYGQTVAYPIGGDKNPTTGYGLTRMANPDLRWEQATEMNLGFDLGMWDDKLQLNVDGYDRQRVDLLGEKPIPVYTGVGAPLFNMATVRNRGVEMALSYRNKEGAFRYEIGGNAAYNQNEVLEVNNSDGRIPGGGSFQYEGQAMMQEGYPLPYFYGFKTDGIFQNEEEVAAYTNEEGQLIQPAAQPGDIRYVDTNGDGSIDGNDRTDIGSPMHDWTLGATARMEYKGFDFSMFWQGQLGGELFNSTQRLDLMEGQNYNARYLNRWTGEGSTNEFPRFTHQDPNKNYMYINDMVHLEDASYVRLKNIQLGYTMPKSIAEKAGMSNFRVYVSMNNALTFTDYSGLDPEVGHGGTMGAGFDMGSYPQARTILIGTNIAF